MKNILIVILCFNIISLPAYCTITDDFAEKTLDKSMQIKHKTQYMIKDDFAEKSLNKNLKIKEVSHSMIIDDFAENNKAKNPKIVKNNNFNEVIPVVTEKQAIRKVVINTDSMQEIPIRIISAFSTKTALDEGDYIDFEIVNDLKIKNKLYPSGTIVKGRVENISLNKAMGVPSDLVIGNFLIDNIPLQGEIEKTGANRSLWVYPCTYVLVWFFGLGLLFIPIRGGHAKIYPHETFSLYLQN